MEIHRKWSRDELATCPERVTLQQIPVALNTGSIHTFTEAQKANSFATSAREASVSTRK